MAEHITERKLLPVGIIRTIVLSAVLLIASVPAYADVFQYFDEEGTLIVTDNPYHIKRPRRQYESRYKDLKLSYRDDVSYDFYTVSANNFPDAIAATKISGPFNRQEKRVYAGETKWTLGWSYKFSSSRRIEGDKVYVSLNIYEIELRSDIVVLLPMLSDNSSMEYHDLRTWESFLNSLLEHEHDHVRIIKDQSFRDEARNRITALRDLVIPYNPASNLDELIRSSVEAETARIGHELIMKIKARNDEYDRITGHGIKHEMRAVFFGG